MLARYLLSSCVRLSVRHKPVLYRNDWTNRAGIWHTGFLPSSPHFLCYKEISVSPKIRVLPSETLFHTPDLENFSTASRSRCQQHSSSTVEFVDDTYTTVDESWLFTTSRSTALLRFVVDLLYNWTQSVARSLCSIRVSCVTAA